LEFNGTPPVFAGTVNCSTKTKAPSFLLPVPLAVLRMLKMWGETNGRDYNSSDGMLVTAMQTILSLAKDYLGR
jgi:hypothetical protein